MGTCPSGCKQTEERQEGGGGAGEDRQGGGTGSEGDLLPALAAGNTASEVSSDSGPGHQALLSTSLVTVHQDKSPASWGLWAEEAAWRLAPATVAPCPATGVLGPLRSICPPGLGWEGGARRLEGAADAGGGLVSAVKSDSHSREVRGEISRPGGLGPAPGQRPPGPAPSLCPTPPWPAPCPRPTPGPRPRGPRPAPACAPGKLFCPHSEHSSSLPERPSPPLRSGTRGESVEHCGKRHEVFVQGCASQLCAELRAGKAFLDPASWSWEWGWVCRGGRGSALRRDCGEHHPLQDPQPPLWVMAAGVSSQA